MQHAIITKLLQITLLLISLAFTTMAAPAAQAHDVAPSSPPPGNYCGKAELTDGHLRELRTSEPWNKCNTLDKDENYDAGLNKCCGLCVMFKYVILVDSICLRRLLM